MHHLVIGEGQIGRAIIERALADGDTVTVLRRSAKEPTPELRRVAGDVLDPAALGAAIEGADAVMATFHSPYDARLWREQLPPREAAVLDAAAEHEIPVVFPESLYGFQGGAASLAEDASPSPQDEKGRIRVELLRARRAHRARTLSVIASDLIGPTTVGTGSAVATAMVLEPILSGRRAILFGRADVPHTLTFVPDLAAAMLHAARHAERLSGPSGDAVLNAPAARADRRGLAPGRQAGPSAAADPPCGPRAARPRERLRAGAARHLGSLVRAVRPGAGAARERGGPRGDELGGRGRRDRRGGPGSAGFVRHPQHGDC